MPARIFISHSSRDADVARALKRQLLRVGIDVFMAPDDMNAAEEWPQQLARAVEECAAVAVLLSDNANGSEHVAREISLAVSRSRPIVTLRLDETEPTGSLGYLLQLKQRIDIFPGPLEGHVERIVAHVRAALEAASRQPDAASQVKAGRCPNCGKENPPRARFCSECSTLLTGATETLGNRRVVTVLFCDVVGSTEMGERVDAEVARATMARYFAEARRVVIRHGGMVEKFIGDAVMAIFGLPTLHEDDALRAMRAALEIQGAVASMGQEPLAGAEVNIRLRIGIATGEVVASDPTVGGTLITGDAVNTSARLQQSAAPDQILISGLAHDLARDAIVAERVPDIAVKGKSEPVAAYRLSTVVTGAQGHTRRLDAPMVGRERELRGLRQSFDDAISERSCHLYTVLGSAGVGKSRLLAEFLAGLTGQARTLEGRCLPYGEGITYWPVREIVHAAAGIDEGDDIAAARAKVGALLGHDREKTEIERCVARAVGLSDEAVAPEELTWGIRRFLEVLAEDLPLVVVFDDIQWGEPTFLDLIEHIAEWARDAPMMLICPARPELLEVRPGWGGGKLNVTSILMEPLPPDASKRLIDGLGAGGLPPRLKDRIAAAAEGNPLFIEEMVNMLRANGVLSSDGTTTIAGPEDQVPVPTSIRVLLAARLDQLLADERAVASRASVIGRTFERKAVAELSPVSDRIQLSMRLASLVRKELVRPDRSSAGEEAYRFRHLLIRDAAYEALPKSERAALHEHFATWLIGAAGDRIAEYEEVIAFHLDEAHRTRLDLGERGAAVAALSLQAADWYVRAARRADAVLDTHSSRPFWQRAVALLDPASQAWLDATYELAGALAMLGDTDAANARYAEVAQAASGREPALAAMARIGSITLSRTGNASWSKEMEQIVRDSLPTLEAHGDHRQLSKAFEILAMTLADNVDPAAYEAARSSLFHAQESRDPNRRRAAAGNLVEVASKILPQAEARAAITQLDASDLIGASRAYLLRAMAMVEAKDGNLPAARNGLAQAIALADRFRQPELMVSMRLDAGRHARCDRDFSAAEPLLRTAVDLAVEYQMSSYWVRYAQARLAMALFDLGREPEAEGLLADLAGHRGEDEEADLIGQVVHARLLGRRRQLTEALVALNDAIRQMPPEFILLRTEAHVEAILMLKEAGRDEEAAAVAAEALAEIQMRPAALYVSMVNEALGWPHRQSDSSAAISVGLTT